MKKEENVKTHIEYGKQNLKQLLTEVLKEQYINYISINEV